MKNKENLNIEVNAIKALYINIKSSTLVKLEEALQQDVTDIFWKGLIGALQHREIINIAMRGKTGSSKSTTGCKILHVLTQELIQEQKIPQMTEEQIQDYLFTRICSDQTEFIRFALKTKGNTIALIDEFSTMGETGFNATTEASLYTEHSNLFAQDYIHKISCSPNHIQDKNADIILDFLGIDEEKKISQFKISYRDPTEYILYTLGIINIYVGDIIEMPFYKRYRIKKFKRLDLLKKYGISNIKELEFSIITRAAYNELKELAYIQKINNDLILSMIVQKRREQKLQYSIITLNYVMMQTKGMLDLVTSIQQLKNKARTAKTPETKEIIQQTIEKFQKVLKNRLDEEDQKIQIYQEYTQIK